MKNNGGSNLQQGRTGHATTMALFVRVDVPQDGGNDKNGRRLPRRPKQKVTQCRTSVKHQERQNKGAGARTTPLNHTIETLGKRK